ncbi:hypothetical protein EON83_05150 [bacterium]|nr:MAG: hypothetical protein EON83_05150 [bacterium]
MGFLDKLFGNNEPEPQRQPTRDTGAFGYGQQQQQGAYSQQEYSRPQNADEQAVARYRYMLQTAPPEDIERAHEEAFARLTPEQRQLLLQQLSQNVPQSEAQNLRDDPRNLARAATRAEVRQPGFIERTFGGNNQQMQGQPGYQQQGYAQPMGGGLMGGMGGMIAGSLLSSMAGSFIGSSIAHSFFSNNSNEQAFQSSPEAAAVDGGVGDYNPVDFQEGGGGLDASADPYGDPADGGFQNAGLDDNQGQDFGQADGGADASADPYGDPGDSGGFDGGGDFGGFDSGGFDGGGDFGGDF